SPPPRASQRATVRADDRPRPSAGAAAPRSSTRATRRRKRPSWLCLRRRARSQPPLGERLELFPRSPQARYGGPHRNAEKVADLELGHLLELEQDDQRPELHGHRFEDLLQDGP